MRVELLSPQGEKVEVLAEVAADSVAQQKGLQGRAELEPSNGMIFIFPDEQVRSFWMKDTLIPLDVIFFDADGGYVASHAMTPCTSSPVAAVGGGRGGCPSYSSQYPARYALEVPGGFLKAHKITNVWELGAPAQLP